MNCRETHDTIQKLPIGDDAALRQISDILEGLNERLAYIEASVLVLKQHVAAIEAKLQI